MQHGVAAHTDLLSDLDKLMGYHDPNYSYTRLRKLILHYWLRQASESSFYPYVSSLLQRRNSLFQSEQQKRCSCD